LVATSAEPPAQFDAIIVGGGVNGTGIARDLALRGLKVALFEKHDFGYGASGNSSGMIHGGPRYMEKSPDVTRRSCIDSGYIQRIAPHLLFRIPFLLPARSARRLFEYDLFFDAYDVFQPLKRGKKHTVLTREEAHILEPGLSDDMIGAVTFDEWGIDGPRLCIANAVDAREHGAVLSNHHEVEAFVRGGGGAVRGVVVRDLLQESRRTVTASVVVNAGGAWGPKIAAMTGLTVQMRPGKGIHLVLDRRIGNYAVSATAVDGRTIFAEPWQNVSLVGTTDDDYYGSLDDLRATVDEVQYLLHSMESVLPGIRQARIIGTTVGVRPTLFRYGVMEDDLSRDHRIIDHTADGAAGLFSLVGGKLASYRELSEEASDLVAARCGNATRCSTHERPLPGGDRRVDPRDLAARFGVSEMAARRVAYRHGARAERVLAPILDDPGVGAVTCACEPVLEAEVRWAIREEMAQTCDDVARRTRLGLGPCGGMRCAARCAQIVAEESDRSPAWARGEMTDFLAARFLARRPALDGDQVRQEELAIARHRLAGGLP
jgi:glycerol-3-phosphate dehydrogenase